MFSVRSARRLYNATLVIFGSHLQVVRGDEKGSLKSETIKYGRKTAPHKKKKRP
jgi:hypothetical protein